MSRRAQVSRRKHPSQQRSRKTVGAILSATSRVLVREGYEAATTTRVAEVAGVSIGSLYQYFPSKEALADQPLEQAVRSFIGAVLLAHIVEPELHAVVTQQLPHVGGFEKVRWMNAQARQLLISYLEQHRKEIRPIDAELAAFVLVHSLQAVVSAAVLERRVRDQVDELAGLLSQLVLRFLSK